jgi:glycosyltransferase involved in cell wall biosynthesis
MNNACICILAHNEGSSIAAAIKSLRFFCNGLAILIKVYANGCTDNTIGEIHKSCSCIPMVETVEIEKPFKVNAWNQAFAENTTDYIVFFDGDIEAGKNAVFGLIQELDKNLCKIMFAFIAFFYRSIKNHYTKFGPVRMHDRGLLAGES